MQDPLKQGLKPSENSSKSRRYAYPHRIRMQDPLKQGLKHSSLYVDSLLLSYSNARSIKTRIETYVPTIREHLTRHSNARSIKTRIETNSFQLLESTIAHSNARSIKTRIETWSWLDARDDVREIRMQDPLKQGLKHPLIQYGLTLSLVFECKIH